MGCPSNIDVFPNSYKSIPTTDDYKTSLDSSSCKHVAAEEDEKMEEMHFLPVCPPHKDVLMALLVFDFIAN
jgi:hypothetical protein